MAWWQAVPVVRTIGVVPDVREITYDSRLVKPGVAFAAVSGFQSDGHDFITAAMNAGAGALVVQADREAKWAPFQQQTPLVVVEDVRTALGPLAAAVYGNPSELLRVVGVTGTDGKTTTTHLAAHVLDSCGLACGYLTSVGFDTGSGFEPNTMHMTTLEGTLIQAALAWALAAGRRSMVVEASSEGLALHRLDGCRFDAAIFTNLSRDHLDFHGTMERYLEAKGILFEKLGETSAKTFPKAAVINADQPAVDYLRGRAGAPVVTYGIDNAADFRATSVRSEGYGLAFRVEAGGDAVEARAPLVGRFNVYNCLAAVAVACSQGIRLKEAVAALATFPGVPGRLEVIDCGQTFRVYVDIASTPAAMENVLNALRPATKGQLWVVFGAAGGRDPARRGGIGSVVARLADRAVLTNEDPREEEPEAIIGAIAKAFREAGRVEGRDFFPITDRREAIRFAFEQAGAEDTVLLAGKGTETTMIIGREAQAWDERAVARELLGGSLEHLP